VEQNRKAGQNPPRVVAPTEEEEGDGQTDSYDETNGRFSQFCEASKNLSKLFI